MEHEYAELLSQAELEVLVPEATEFDLEAAPSLSSVPLRSSLQFDRPRVRAQHPMMSFKATAILKQPSSIPDDSHDPYLPDGVPASINVLEGLGGDSGYGSIKPQLTALRLDRINLNNNLVVKEQIIRTLPQKPFPALPAISARVRYSKSGAYTSQPSIIAILDIETAPFQDDEVQLTRVNIELSDGSVEDLCQGRAIHLPMICRPKDNIIFLFRLLPDADRTYASNVSSDIRTLDISIDAHVLVSDICRPNIEMKWKTTVDFSTALNPKLGRSLQAMQRSERPSNPSVASDNDKRVHQDDTVPFDDAEDPHSNQSATSLAGFGITMTFTAPRDVYVGRPFTWDVFLVNHSRRARKLAIIVVPRRKSADRRSQPLKTSGSSTTTGQTGKTDYADAVMDDHRLYAMQKALAKEDVEIVCLSTEVRLGNLNPGFCHNTELKFLPLAKGVLHIEAVRVIDLVENRSIDVRDLPEIVAEERGVDD
ncbi:MAG: hypothetical protein Q9219_000511 [cf. Caloplaca sp. 3 TL-2023]